MVERYDGLISVGMPFDQSELEKSRPLLKWDRVKLSILYQPWPLAGDPAVILAEDDSNMHRDIRIISR